MVVYDNKCETNISNFENNLRVPCHEEADTLIVLHRIDVAKHDPFQELYIDWWDTDVFLLLLYYFEKICTRTVFNGKNDCIDIGMLYEVLDIFIFIISFLGVIKPVNSRGFQKKLVGEHF